MKPRVNILWTKFQQISSLLLMLLFLSISAAPVFHDHKHSHTTQHVDCGSEEKTQLIDKCAICDYCHHVQGKQILLFYPQQSAILKAEVTTLDTRVLSSNYKFTLQGFTNKGPPSLS